MTVAKLFYKLYTSDSQFKMTNMLTSKATNLFYFIHKHFHLFQLHVWFYGLNISCSDFKMNNILTSKATN